MDVGGIVYAAAFHRRRAVPFPTDSVGWQHKSSVIIVCVSLGFKMLLCMSKKSQCRLSKQKKMKDSVCGS